MALMIEKRRVVEESPPILSEARKTLEVSDEIITPAKASEWITEDVNGHNRNLNSRRVMAYARDMENGQWRFNNDAICFSVGGVLINGQHRLHACIMADKPFRSVVVRGMPPQAQDVMDQHAIRSVAGMLQLRGFARTVQLSGAARSLVNIAHAADGYLSYRPNPQELLEIVDKHPELVRSIAVATSCRGISPSALSAVHYCGKVLLNMPEKAEAFVQVFNTGVPAYPGDPAHLLREATLRHQERKTSKTESVKFFSLLRAWNAFVDEESWGKWVSPQGTVTINGLKPEMI